MKQITANDLKTRGVSSIDQALQDADEALISIRGQDRYVVMGVEAYNRLRVCELDAALYQCQQEIAEGKGIEESAADHLARVQNMEP